jgi:hypothetical protein
MTTEQQDALVELAVELSKIWSDLPIEVCNAWENFENSVPDGEFRDRLRAENSEQDETEPVVLAGARRIIATFTPQAWTNDQAMEVDCEGPNTWDVTDQVHALGKDAALALRDDSNETDAFRSAPTAPNWIRDWSGPFYIEVADSIGQYFDEQDYPS